MCVCVWEGGGGGESGEVMIINDIFPGSTGDGTGHISLLWPQHE